MNAKSEIGMDLTSPKSDRTPKISKAKRDA